MEQCRCEKYGAADRYSTSGDYRGSEGEVEFLLRDGHASREIHQARGGGVTRERISVPRFAGERTRGARGGVSRCTTPPTRVWQTLRLGGAGRRWKARTHTHRRDPACRTAPGSLE